MRQVIPKQICEMQDKCIPYLHYVDGQGVGLVPDAPPEIIQLKRQVDAWFAEHDRDI